MTIQIFRRFILVASVAPAFLTGCDHAEADSVGLDPDTPWWVAEGVAPPAQIDSLFSMDDALERFHGEEAPVTELADGALSREGLLEAFISHLSEGDGAALAALAITRSEFGWLYFPHSIYTRPPYELSPELLWMQQQNYGSRGLTRLIDQFGGKELYYDRLECPNEAGEAFGEGRIWDGCLVIGALPTGERSEERLFGSILEVGGRYKFVSFTNEL